MMILKLKNRRIQYLNALKQYEKRDAPFHQINPDMVDGMLIKICEKHGWKNLSTFFRYFHDEGPISAKIVEKANTMDERVTIVIAALSAAMDDDLRPKFRAWNFPIDDKIYDMIVKTITI